MHRPCEVAVVQQHVNGELCLQFRALVDGQGHDAFAQRFPGKRRQLVPDEDWRLLQQSRSDRPHHTAIGSTHVVDRHGIGMRAERVFQSGLGPYRIIAALEDLHHRKALRKTRQIVGQPAHPVGMRLKPQMIAQHDHRAGPGRAIRDRKYPAERPALL